MRFCFIISMVVCALSGCEEGSSQDQGDGQDADGGSVDAQGVKTGQGDGTEEGETATGEDALLHYSVVRFCNRLSTEYMTRLDLSEGPYVAFFAATANCCTRCRKVSAGDIIVLDLYDDDGALAHEQVPLEDGGEYVIFAVEGEGGAAGLVLDPLAAEGCEATVPDGMSQCE
jgi:hypothetical protein